MEVRKIWLGKNILSGGNFMSRAEVTMINFIGVALLYNVSLYSQERNL